MIVALTGGIGSGKSEAARQFKALGVPIVDADVIAHELTALNEPILDAIRQTFGDTFINTDGTLNRAKLRKCVFESPAERLKLEALIHPAIHERVLKQLSENEHLLQPVYQVLVIPILFENNRFDGIANKILVIDCDETLQIQRTMARSQMSESEVKDMMHAQVSRSLRLELAGEVIANNGSLAELQKNITEFHKNLIKTCIVSK